MSDLSHFVPFFFCSVIFPTRSAFDDCTWWAQCCAITVCFSSTLAETMYFILHVQCLQVLRHSLLMLHWNAYKLVLLLRISFLCVNMRRAKALTSSPASPIVQAEVSYWKFRVVCKSVVTIPVMTINCGLSIGLLIKVVIWCPGEDGMPKRGFFLCLTEDS